MTAIERKIKELTGKIHERGDREIFSFQAGQFLVITNHINTCEICAVWTKLKDLDENYNCKNCIKEGKSETSDELKKYLQKRCNDLEKKLDSWSSFRNSDWLYKCWESDFYKYKYLKQAAYEHTINLSTKEIEFMEKMERWF